MVFKDKMCCMSTVYDNLSPLRQGQEREGGLISGYSITVESISLNPSPPQTSGVILCFFFSCFSFSRIELSFIPF